jgi:hypothetical protein
VNIRTMSIFALMACQLALASSAHARQPPGSSWAYDHVWKYRSEPSRAKCLTAMLDVVVGGRVRTTPPPMITSWSNKVDHCGGAGATFSAQASTTALSMNQAFDKCKKIFLRKLHERVEWGQLADGLPILEGWLVGVGPELKLISTVGFVNKYQCNQVVVYTVDRHVP